MDPGKYGPFANVVALAGTLVAVFGVLLLKMLGGLKRWTWLAADTPAFLVAAGARVLAVALMAVTYVTIDPSNYGWFGGAAVVGGVFGFFSVMRFDRLRKLHVIPIPVIGPDGNQLQDEHGTKLAMNVVIGLEDQLRPEAATALKIARNQNGVSLAKFMSGYGSAVNNPDALWDRAVLADIGNKLTASLMQVVLFAVVTLFLAAFVVDVGVKGTQ